MQQCSFSQGGGKRKREIVAPESELSLDEVRRGHAPVSLGQDRQARHGVEEC